MTRWLRILALLALATACASPAPSPVSSAAQTGSPSSVPASSSIQSAQPGSPSATGAAAAGPSGFQLFASGFPVLTFVTQAGDGSGVLYAVAQAGAIYQVSQGQSAPTPPWLDISARVSSGGERGLLGLAFDPDFRANGRLYVDYTDVNGNSVISQFTRAADGTVDSASEKVLLNVSQPFPNHNGGMLAFGPDGYLYIGLGDGGGAGDTQGSGQSLSTLLGKILRIDVTSGDPYAIPPTNPFQPGNAQGAQPEIWDWGVRNPWRFSFDNETGGLFIGDVGQNSTEEVDVERAGLGSRNYGWNIMEGDHCFNATTCNQNGLTLPVATYSHDNGNCSVTGGYVYRGQRVPSLDGLYFYADYCSGTVWTFDSESALAGRTVPPVVFGQAHFNVSSFGQDEAGELYLVSHDGAIWTLTANPALP